jgi:rubrerythrin
MTLVTCWQLGDGHGQVLLQFYTKMEIGNDKPHKQFLICPKCGHLIKRVARFHTCDSCHWQEGKAN